MPSESEKQEKASSSFMAERELEFLSSVPKQDALFSFPERSQQKQTVPKKKNKRKKKK